MDLFIEIDKSVNVRELSTRKVLDSTQFFASLLNLLVLRGQYLLPEAAAIEEFQLATLVSDFLAVAAEHFPAKNGYSVDDARSFILAHARSPVTLNPHCNNPTSFEPSPVLAFLDFFGLPLFHSALADPAEAFALRSQLERHGTWANAAAHASESPEIQSLIESLVTRPAGITPAFASAIASLADDAKFDYALLYNPATSGFHVLAHTRTSSRTRPADRVPAVFHATPVDVDGWVAYEHLATAATALPGNTIDDAHPRKFTDEAFNPLPVYDVGAEQLFVDLSHREQADKDYALALAMEDSAAVEAARHAVGMPQFSNTFSTSLTGGDKLGGPGSFVPPKPMTRSKSKSKDKSKKEEKEGEGSPKKGKKLFGSLFRRKRSSSRGRTASPEPAAVAAAAER
ncbi:hypothetical protein H9P43_004989 [Blastocladiella emersonii ATCC 22665]|nr:hypothetical protein H9P43_004989 [Blastocladiella emersonii ATCC 22665]